MADYYWYGTTALWGTGSNWKDSAGTAYGVPPTSSDNVFFGVYGTYGRNVACQINVDATCNNLYMDSTYTIAAGISVLTTVAVTTTVSGNFTNYGQTGFVVNQSSVGTNTLIINGTTILSNASTVNCRFGLRDIAIFNGDVYLGIGANYGSTYNILKGNTTYNGNVYVGTNGLLGLTTGSSAGALTPRFTIASGKTIWNSGTVYIVVSITTADNYYGEIYGPGKLTGNRVRFYYNHATTNADPGLNLILRLGGNLQMEAPIQIPITVDNFPSSVGSGAAGRAFLRLAGDDVKFGNISIEASGTFDATNGSAANYSCSSSGNFDNIGTFTSGLGTFTFDGPSATIDSGEDPFNNVTLNAANISLDTTNLIVRGRFLAASGVFNANGLTVTNNFQAMF